MLRRRAAPRLEIGNESGGSQDFRISGFKDLRTSGSQDFLAARLDGSERLIEPAVDGGHVEFGRRSVSAVVEQNPLRVAQQFMQRLGLRFQPAVFIEPTLQAAWREPPVPLTPRRDVQQ